MSDPGPCMSSACEAGLDSRNVTCVSRAGDPEKPETAGPCRTDEMSAMLEPCSRSLCSPGLGQVSGRGRKVARSPGSFFIFLQAGVRTPSSWCCLRNTLSANMLKVLLKGVSQADRN